MLRPEHALPDGEYGPMLRLRLLVPTPQLQRSAEVVAAVERVRVLGNNIKGFFAPVEDSKGYASGRHTRS